MVLSLFGYNDICKFIFGVYANLGDPKDLGKSK